MKKYKKIFLMLISFMLPLIVSAEEFKYGDVNYSLERVNDSCIENYITDAYPVSLVGTSVLYTDHNNEEYVLVSNDGTCFSDVKLSDIFEARETLKFIMYDYNEITEGTYIVQKVYYPVVFERFTNKLTNEIIELAHYDKETLDSNITYYKREKNMDPNNFDYAVIVEPEDLKEEDIQYYYYELEGNFSVQYENIASIDKATYEFAENNYGQFVKSPRSDRIFYKAFTDDNYNKYMVYLPDVSAILFDEIDNIDFVDIDLFIVSESGNSKIMDSVQKTYITINDFIDSESVYVNDSAVLIRGYGANDELTTYVLKKYDVLSDDGQIYSEEDMDFKFTGEIKEIDKILINNNKLDISNYNFDNKTLTVTLKKSYLETLNSGTYTLTIKYLNGIEVSTTFRIYNEIEVTFDANGGFFSDNKTTYVVTDWIDAEYDYLSVPTREGYKFKGYYTEKKGGTSIKHIMNESGIEDDMIFYAQWEENTINNKDNLDNPQTGDNVKYIIIIAILSIVGIIGTSICLKKEKNS